MSGHNTGIEWTHHPGYRGETWNPLAAFDKETGERGWFCTHVSEGCRHCYAEKMNVERPFGMGTGHEYKHQNLKEIEFRLVNLDQPIRWQKPRSIFVNSMTDLFHEEVPFRMIDKVFAAMCCGQEHRFMILTKRPGRMREYMDAESRDWSVFRAIRENFAPEWRENSRLEECPLDWPPENVWLGTSVENQDALEERVPELQQTPAAVRFLSCEPLLGPLNFTIWSEPIHINLLKGEDGVEPSIPGIDWVIAGGESGPNARPMHPDWVREICGQCREADVPFFFKQWGAWKPISEMEDAGDGYYKPNKKAESEAEQMTYNEIYGRECTVDTMNLQYDGQEGIESVDGHTQMQMFRVGKKEAGRELDGRTHDAFPEVEATVA